MKAALVTGWLAKPQFVHQWLTIAQAKSGKASAPPVTNKLDLLGLLLQGAPKLRAILYSIIDIVVRDQHKDLCLSCFRIVDIGALALANLRAILYIANMNVDELEDAVRRFNTNPTSDYIFITSYAKGGYEMNLANRCCHILITEPPPSEVAIA